MNRLRLTSYVLFILLPIAVVFSAYLFLKLKDTIGIIIPVFMIGICFLMAIPPLISFFSSAQWSPSSIRVLTLINSLEIALISMIGLWLIITSIMSTSDHPQQKEANRILLQQYTPTPAMQGIIDKSDKMFSTPPYFILCDESNSKCFALLLAAPDSPVYNDFGSSAIMKRPASESNPKPNQIKYKAVTAGFLIKGSFIQPTYQEYTEVYSDSESSAQLQLLNEFTQNHQFYNEYSTKRRAKFWDQWMFRQ